MRVLALALVAVLLQQAPALAQPGPGSSEYRGQGPGRDMQRREDRDQWRRERREEMRQRDTEHRPNWMSPDDRRELRRDIREYGRDVYRERERERRQ